MTLDQTITETFHVAAGAVDASVVSGTQPFSITVDGRINSITVMPWFVILGTGQSVPEPFDIAPYFHPNIANPPQWTTVYATGSPLTIRNWSDMPDAGVSSSSVDVTFGSDFGVETVLGSIRYYHNLTGSQDQTYETGLMITSLDYTPSGASGGGVPDASNTAALLGVGMFGVLWAARRATNVKRDT